MMTGRLSVNNDLHFSLFLTQSYQIILHRWFPLNYFNYGKVWLGNSSNIFQVFFWVKLKSYRAKQQKDEEIITYFWVTYSCNDENFNSGFEYPQDSLKSHKADFLQMVEGCLFSLWKWMIRHRVIAQSLIMLHNSRLFFVHMLATS